MTKPPVALNLEPVSLLGQLDPTDKLSDYFSVLQAENEKVNLVSRETIASGLPSLAAESLFPLAQISQTGFDRYLDIGSGGGFPAVPILLTSQVREATLLERGNKKSLALERILRALGLPRDRISVDQASFEQCTFDSQFDLITLRLVKLRPRIWRKVVSSLAGGGYFVYYSIAPDDIALAGLTPLSYCYQIGTPPLTKYFTIFQKTRQFFVD
ncbi:MAG: class I SAM-dependent methyltransferase [Candidatus Zixiibacteriota bacterium]|nr:MAG: class I SAM-dependent methyltransferase [candidate division Zixibacteria bacterium]